MSTRHPHFKKAVCPRSSLTTLAIVVMATLILVGTPNILAQQAGQAKQQSNVTLRQLSADLATASSQMRQLQNDITSLNSKINQIETGGTKLSNDFAALKKNLDETGWHALDFSTKRENVHWTMFAAGLTIISLLMAVLNIALYGNMRNRLENAVDQSIKHEEERVQTSLDKKGEELKTSLRDEEEQLKTRLREEMNEKLDVIRRKIETSRSRIHATSLGVIGQAFWQQHNDVQLNGTRTLWSEKFRNLEAAISLSKHAIEATKGLDQNEPEHETLLCSANINRAYYLADMVLLLRDNSADSENRSVAGECSEALALAKKGLPTAIKYRDNELGDDRWAEWMESYCWVLWVCGDQAQKELAKNLAEELAADQRVPDDLREWIRDRYVGAGHTQNEPHTTGAQRSAISKSGEQRV